jgi:molybdopterin molybdotransferase
MSDFATGVSFHEAMAIVQDVATRHRLDTELLSLSRSHGRLLAQDVDATMPLPAFDNSAMDGFAFRHEDLQGAAANLQLVGDQFAGRTTGIVVGANECVRITTGAPVPVGADTVVMKENTVLEHGRVTITGNVSAGANIRHAGEDVRIGDRVLRKGQALTPARISLAASLGFASLQVSRKPTVAVFTSGDELIEPGMPLAPGEIYDSNRELLMGLLRADGLEPTAWPRLPDDSKRVEIALRDAACAFDLIITCGAVSAGEKDHIPAVLAEECRQGRAQTHFWKVRMKPGMPVLFGSMDQARLLGLPGNPVSVMATYLTLGRALIDGLQGRTEPRPVWRARLVSAIDKPHPRREFVRGVVSGREDGSLEVTPNSGTGSHRLRAAAESNALIVVPDGPQTLAAGDTVDVLMYA